METIEDWVAEEKKRLDRFAVFYKKEAAKPGNRDSFPSKMDSGEWDEQYRLWDGR